MEPRTRLQTVDEMDRSCASPVGRAVALGRPASRLELLREEYQQTLAAVCGCVVCVAHVSTV